MRELAWVKAFPQIRHWHGFSPGEAAGGLSHVGIETQPPSPQESPEPLGKHPRAAEPCSYLCGCGRAAAAPRGQRTAAGSERRRRASPRCGSGGAASGCLQAAASQGDTGAPPSLRTPCSAALEVRGQVVTRAPRRWAKPEQAPRVWDDGQTVLLRLYLQQCSRWSPPNHPSGSARAWGDGRKHLHTPPPAPLRSIPIWDTGLVLQMFLTQLETRGRCLGRATVLHRPKPSSVPPANLRRWDLTTYQPGAT